MSSASVIIPLPIKIHKISHETRTKMKNILRTLLSSEEGATAAEYAVMASLIAVVIIGAVTLLGLNTSNLFQNVADKYPK